MVSNKINKNLVEISNYYLCINSIIKFKKM